MLSGPAVQLFEEDILEDLPSAELEEDALVEHPSPKSEVVTETQELPLEKASPETSATDSPEH